VVKDENGSPTSTLLQSLILLRLMELNDYGINNDSNQVSLQSLRICKKSKYRCFKLTSITFDVNFNSNINHSMYSILEYNWQISSLSLKTWIEAGSKEFSVMNNQFINV
jgi:hypothetical protein